MAFYQFRSEQKINTSIDEIWDFISSPTNLKEITPDYMGFDIMNTRQLSEKMYEGMIIGYKVSPLLGIKTTWVTEITHIRDKEFFIDEQRIGPYAMWHHQHLIRPIENGVLMSIINKEYSMIDSEELDKASSHASDIYNQLLEFEPQD